MHKITRVSYFVTGRVFLVTVGFRNYLITWPHWIQCNLPFVASLLDLLPPYPIYCFQPDLLPKPDWLADFSALYKATKRRMHYIWKIINHMKKVYLTAVFCLLRNTCTSFDVAWLLLKVVSFTVVPTYAFSSSFEDSVTARNWALWPLWPLWPLSWRNLI